MWLKAIFSFRFRKVWARDACGLLDLHTAGFVKRKQKNKRKQRRQKAIFLCKQSVNYKNFKIFLLSSLRVSKEEQHNNHFFLFIFIILKLINTKKR